MSCAWVLSVLWLSVPLLVPLRVFLLFLLLLPELWAEPLPTCGRNRGNIPLALRQMRSLALWPKTHLSQVMSPCSLKTSTTQRLLKSSSGTNPATRCPRTGLTPNSTMRPSAERSPLHCSFRSEKKQRTEDKLITLSWRKFAASSVLFCVSFKNGETRAWTWFVKFMQQRRAKSRLRKRANQDSPWTTNRANSCWF